MMKKPKKTKKWLLIGLFVIILGLVLGIYLWWHSAASTSSVTYGPSSNGVALGSETTLVPWQTSFFTTKISTSLRKLTSTETPQNPIVGQYLFTGKGLHDSDQLAVSIGGLSGGSLREISAIKLRADQPNNYKQSNRSFAPAGAIVFEARTGYETSVFWQHGSQYVAVVTSGLPSDSTDLDQDVSDVMTNWQWR
jgi:hypothetical protein